MIVVGEDYSQNSSDALKAACNFAETLAELSIHVVHVTNPSSDPFANDLGTSIAATNLESPDELKAERAALKAVTLSNAASVAEHGAHVFGHLRSGRAAPEIVQLASDLSADLIVVGTHGRTGMKKRSRIATRRGRKHSAHRAEWFPKNVSLKAKPWTLVLTTMRQRSARVAS